MARRNPLSLLATVVVIAGAATLARRTAGGGTTHPVQADVSSCIESECQDPVRTVQASLGTAVVTLEERDACRDTAYLCRGLEWRDGMARVLRWDEDTKLIRIRVPVPSGDPSRGREVRDAAIRGIRAWDGHPFPLQVEDRDRGLSPDFIVEWMTAPPGNQLGQAGTRWTQTAGRTPALQVTSFRLSLVSPQTGQQLSAEQIELTAAHEMGHALGLPHSDEPRDVMYPTNTANTLSARDYKAMQALYQLPNGAGIRQPDERADQ